VPESVKDRPTVTHEYILMLTQARFYQYFPEKATENAVSDWSLSGGELGNGQRNHRSVWQMGTSVGHGNHAAAFPLSLPLRCIRATAKAGDIVFDPFTGSGTTLVAAKTLGCRYFGCDISPTYVAEATERLMRVEDEADLPAEPTYQQAYLFTAPSKQML
ncbi:MAG: site-specific DNA-methyltransferase, partial [Chloroflexi bacterium]|nr:site-specific DNA-methyltransferase [Chloroflexota bacterium]